MRYGQRQKSSVLAGTERSHTQLAWNQGHTSFRNAGKQSLKAMWEWMHQITQVTKPNRHFLAANERLFSHSSSCPWTAAVHLTRGGKMGDKAPAPGLSMRTGFAARSAPSPLSFDGVSSYSGAIHSPSCCHHVHEFCIVARVVMEATTGSACGTPGHRGSTCLLTSVFRQIAKSIGALQNY